MFSVLLSHIPLLVLVSPLFITYVNSRPQKFSSVADFEYQSCLTSEGQPGICKLSGFCSWSSAGQPLPPPDKTTAGEVGGRYNCGSTDGQHQRMVCCPPDESTVLFPDSIDVNSFESSARNDTVAMPRIAVVEDENSADSLHTWPGDSTENIIWPRLPRNCGKVPIDVMRARIAGGVVAPKGAWPWLARLGYWDGTGITYNCAGVLITKHHVLTAAHCVYNRRNLIFVRLGDHGTTEYGPQDYYIERVTVHQRYVKSGRGSSYDIAIIRLSDFIPFTSDIQPICLPIDRRWGSLDIAGISGYVAGWGSTSYYEPASSVLMEVQLPVVSQSKCARAYRSHSQLRIDGTVLCAGLDSGGKDACRGDSGAPLMFQVGEKFVVVGLVSFGVRCATPGYPGVYSRVSVFTDWILQNISR
ncbi:venom protease-like [Daphnia pulex]|uniref:venom protease-like n=1 Tax=Daphnia pulex TaxID=6669 RepID=UPI001EDE7F12|nr:venom protease-like [Daphnia pulex]